LEGLSGLKNSRLIPDEKKKDWPEVKAKYDQLKAKEA